MTPIEYLKSLIAGQSVSEIPVQLCELQFLLALLEKDKNDRKPKP